MSAPKLAAVHATILRTYPRAVAHMRQQYTEHRFGLIFGAGLSKPFGLPTWFTLVESLAKDPKIDGKRILAQRAPSESLPYRTELLFEHFRKRKYDAAPKTTRHTRELDYAISSQWVELVRHHLYAGHHGKFDNARKKHPYLNAYLPLIAHSHMTVTFNFDN